MRATIAGTRATKLMFVSDSTCTLTERNTRVVSSNSWWLLVVETSGTLCKTEMRRFFAEFQTVKTLNFG